MSLSSQSSGFSPVPFSVAVSQQSFRLMELPPELVALVEKQRESDTGRARKSRLQFKSAIAQAVPGTSSEPIQGHLHLCTDDKVWAVKQVSTSNSIYISRTCTFSNQESRKEIADDQRQEGNCRDEGSKVGNREKATRTDSPINSRQEPSEDTDGDVDMVSDSDADRTRRSPAQGHPETCTDSGSRQGVAAISQVRNILELLEIKPDDADIENSIRAIVPTYDDPDHDGDEVLLRMPKRGPDPSSSVITLGQVLDNIPAPTKLIVSLLRELFAFTVPRHQGQKQISAVYTPTSRLLLRTWKTFVQQCAISGVKLDTREGLDGQQLDNIFRGLREDAGAEEDGNLSVAVTKAILRQLGQPLTGDGDGDEIHDGKDSAPELDLGPLDITGGTLVLKDTDICKALGHWILSSLQDKPSSSIGLEDFMKQWTELLPESWAKDCDATALVRSIGGGVQLVKASGTEPSVLRWPAPVNSNGSLGGPVAAVSGPRPAHPAAVVKDGATRGQNQDQNQNQKKRKWHEKFGAQRRNVER